MLNKGDHVPRFECVTIDDIRVNYDDLWRFSGVRVRCELGGLDTARLQPGRPEHVVEAWVGGQNGDLDQLGYLATGSE